MRFNFTVLGAGHLVYTPTPIDGQYILAAFSHVRRGREVSGGAFKKAIVSFVTKSIPKTLPLHILNTGKDISSLYQVDWPKQSGLSQ